MAVLSAPFRRLALVPFLLLAAYPARSDTLQLANGDRLQGRLVARAEGKIRWESPVLGMLTLAESQATILPDSPAAPAAVQPVPAPAAKPATAQAAAAERWKTTIESGLVLQSGRSERADVNLRAESTLQRRRNTFRLQAKYLYSKADGSVTTDRTEAAFRWRRELDKHWFSQAVSSYFAAKIKGIDHNLEQNVGLGYRLLKTERTQASLGAGLTGQYRKITNADTGRSLFGEIFQDFATKLTPRLDLGEDFAVQYSPSGRGIRILANGSVQIIDTDVMNYKHTLSAYLKGKFTDTLSLALRYEYEFDNTYVSDNAKADQRITTSLGYTF